MKLLEISHLDVRYGPIQALKGVSMDVDEGEIVTLLGANGAGKTTLMRVISGLMRARSGEIFYRGKAITRVAADRVVCLGISQVPEGRRVFATLTVAENLLLGGYTRTAPELEQSLKAVMTMFPRLRERSKQLAGTLSGGEQQMLAIGRALVSRPKLLLRSRPRPRAGLGRVQCHGGANERLQRLLVDRVALMEIDGAARVAFEAGVEEAGRILQRSTLGEGHLHGGPVRLAGADHSVVVPHRHSTPLPFLDHVAVGPPDQCPDPGERFAPPIAEFLDPRIDQSGRGVACARFFRTALPVLHGGCPLLHGGHRSPVM